MRIIISTIALALILLIHHSDGAAVMSIDFGSEWMKVKYLNAFQILSHTLNVEKDLCSMKY
jgi:hypothetical protein